MRFLAVLVAAALVLYPVLVYFGSRWLEPRYLGLAILGIYLIRGLIMARSVKLTLGVCATAVLAGALMWWLNSETLLLLVPAFINAVMATAFGWSLYRRPTIPGRIARRVEGELTPAIERYTTRVTCLWVAFFCFNGAIAAVTALWASHETWLLYNGLIAYLLIGTLFVGEYLYRQLVVKKRL